MNFGGTVHLNRMGVCVVFFCFIIIALYMTRDVDDAEPKKLATVNLKDLLYSAIDVAERGGEQVVKVRKSADLKIRSKGKTNEGANNPVTEADYNSHCVMYFGLKKTFPTLKIISEEEMQEEQCGGLAVSRQGPRPEAEGAPGAELELSSADLTVWLDPLDATQEFTENLLEYVTTLVCVAYKGRPIIGVIHRPFGERPRTSWAWVGQGMSRDLLAYKNVVGEGGEGVVVSRSHSGPVVDVVRRALGEKVPVIKAGGAGYKIMQVVSGNASAYIHTTAIKKWDICAGHAVLTAAGGSLTALTGEDIDYSAQAGALNREGLLATLRRHEEYVAKIHQALQKPLQL